MVFIFLKLKQWIYTVIKGFFYYLKKGILLIFNFFSTVLFKTDIIITQLFLSLDQMLIKHVQAGATFLRPIRTVSFDKPWQSFLTITGHILDLFRIQFAFEYSLLLNWKGTLIVFLSWFAANIAQSRIISALIVYRITGCLRHSFGTTKRICQCYYRWVWVEISARHIAQTFIGYIPFFLLGWFTNWEELTNFLFSYECFRITPEEYVEIAVNANNISPENLDTFKHEKLEEFAKLIENSQLSSDQRVDVNRDKTYVDSLNTKQADTAIVSFLVLVILTSGLLLYNSNMVWW